jgi:hypothetical protein
MNVEIGNVVAQFLFWEYLFQIFGIGSLQCTPFALCITRLVYYINAKGFQFGFFLKKTEKKGREWMPN